MKKLKNGDYCENLTKEQFEELIEIEGHDLKLNYSKRENSLIFNGRVFLMFSTNKITLLSFEEFKQRAINTFRK